MEPSVRRTAMPTVAGVFCIVLGAFQALWFIGLLIAGLVIVAATDGGYYYIPPEMPATAFFVVLAIIALALAVISILGGIFALQRRNWGFALAGAITSFLPFNLLGIVPIVLLALSKWEFDRVYLPPPPPLPPQSPPPPAGPT